MTNESVINKVKEWKMPFGKYKNQLFKDIPDKYLAWIYEETEMFGEADDKKYKYNAWIRQYLEHVANELDEE